MRVLIVQTFIDFILPHLSAKMKIIKKVQMQKLKSYTVTQIQTNRAKQLAFENELIKNLYNL